MIVQIFVKSVHVVSAKMMVKTWNDGSVLYMQNCGYSDLCVVNKYTYFHKKNILVLTGIKKPDENYYLSLKNISEKYIGE